MGETRLLHRINDRGYGIVESSVQRQGRSASPTSSSNCLDRPLHFYLHVCAGLWSNALSEASS